MPYILYKTTIFIIIMMSALSVSAQQRKLVTYQTHQPGRGLVEMQAYVSESVDEQPHFPGGDMAMLKFINRERRYPAEAYEAGVEGRVLCCFIVSESGEISNVEVVKSVESTLDAEAVRIINRMPRWVAGKIGDEKVSTCYLLTIAFRR